MSNPSLNNSPNEILMPHRSDRCRFAGEKSIQFLTGVRRLPIAAQLAKSGGLPSWPSVIKVAKVNRINEG